MMGIIIILNNIYNEKKKYIEEKIYNFLEK